LDGDRLVEAPRRIPGGGDYRRWRDGTERIFRVGELGAADGSFQVWRADGTIWTYGGPGGKIRGARVEAGPDGALSTGPEETYAWLVTRVEDRHSNFMEYQYRRTVHDDFTVGGPPPDRTRATQRSACGEPCRSSTRPDPMERLPSCNGSADSASAQPRD
jgi:hypothetical protein